ATKRLRILEHSSNILVFEERPAQEVAPSDWASSAHFIVGSDLIAQDRSRGRIPISKLLCHDSESTKPPFVPTQSECAAQPALSCSNGRPNQRSMIAPADRTRGAPQPMPFLGAGIRRADASALSAVR